MMRTSADKSSHSDNSVDQELWYVRDRRIQTRSAARKAMELAARVRCGRGSEPVSDDAELFAAMHTCAYRATRCGLSRSADERREWIRRWRDLREYIVNKHLGLAYLVLSRIEAGDWDEDDRASQAIYTLGRAVRRFNPWKGFRFSTYAYNAIVRALMRRLRREHRYRQLFPTQFDVAYELPTHDRSLDDEWYYAEKLRRVFADNLAGLTVLEAGIINRRFLSPSQGVTLQKVGLEMGLCKERIRQLQSVALKKLRAALEAEPV